MNIAKPARVAVGTIVIGVSAALGPMPVLAADAGAVNCLQISQISNTRIIDDQNIVFKVRNNTFYNNKLPNKCSGLKSANKFTYSTSQSVLCNVDIITVLHDSGPDMMRGASCGLGVFTPTQDPDKKVADKEKSS